MPIHLYDTRAREKRPFEPANPERVSMYVCGPTVYGRAHIGNMRPVIVFDVLFRLLRLAFGEKAVVYARNLTDVDDKIINAANEEGVPATEITKRYTDTYHEDTDGLGALRPTLEPRATDYIDEMINLMERLERDGHAYFGETTLWFSVESEPNYGDLSGRSLEDLKAGARVETLEEKRHPADFALWKLAKPGEPPEMTWDSPWGAGRPGWHTECVSMIHALLGDQIDIHGGGIDLVFPHHENERAQSECVAHGPFVDFWMHNGFLDMGDEKMSKSLGNVIYPNDLLKHWHGEVLRYAMLSAHYRAPLTWNEDLLTQSKETLDKMYGALRRAGESTATAEVDGAFLAALEDDLNTPEALAVLNGLASQVNRAIDKGEDASAAAAALRATGQLVGLLVESPETWEKGADDADTARIDQLVADRVAARAAKNWGEADRIRDELAAEGVEIMDGAGGTAWRRV